MQIAMVGLGRMGSNMAARLLRKGHQVVAYNRTFEKTEALVMEEGGYAARSLEEVAEQLDAPRAVWLMLPAGGVVDQHVDSFLEILEPGDVLIDGGNTHYRDDPGRHDRARAKSVRYLDVGVSGGVWGLTEGYSLMIGGPRDAFEQLEPVLRDLAPEKGYLYCGSRPGAGHFVKMVHNGIEYALMQAYAEGFNILEHSDYADELDYADVCEMWNHGSVIRSWLLELAGNAFRESPRLEGIQAWVSDSGEGRWTVQQAVDTAVPAPVITLSLMERFRSREESSFADRLLASLRNQFGGHAVKSTE
ncbi:decarboxylating 6-phosphogluconate dehydrogenase [Oceanidesulfovibrio indonesiensis]|uniref:Decarboxylating 6-phosphogluconate dehydrogenase n=1 Tax=Oceanidesulfovibrio indonesiensis TaxID=54767 RepID=A0A7M3MJX6_9BACT|nr:decarboxylating 6-phosphogluconate dehydrogenase [Oceanidesulfovibrio indonesiensis]TVM19806.1 decarboxylating 6-phosphogluconate dehydrogenase [Oceanidesulfovibrio indonesiensis]